ncbi:transcriptional repressor LexA [Desulfosediminicola flagellatus]|uniref:transcriptional repressor LexA n=1 Tax=Desulfosediminicola flagellatus TaxID=2569541 RepID=UPI0010AD40D9|nr:transcriptional repressor LexA [Desulfosediminicola flagellatus]
MELTDRQQRFYDYLADKIGNDGRAPSLREAAVDMGVSHNAVAQLIGQLERKGMLEREGHYSRSIRLLPEQESQEDEQSRGRELPIIGQVTAGLPMYAQQEWNGTVVVDSQLFSGDNLFCLRIKGDSMQNAGILDGDLVICEPRQYAQNGEIVAVLIHDEEATVKRFYLHDDHIEMRPENDAYPVMRYQFGELLIQGKVIGVLRGDNSVFDGGVKNR